MHSLTQLNTSSRLNLAGSSSGLPNSNRSNTRGFTIFRVLPMVKSTNIVSIFASTSVTYSGSHLVTAVMEEAESSRSVSTSIGLGIVENFGAVSSRARTEAESCLQVSAVSEELQLSVLKDGSSTESGLGCLPKLPKRYFRYA
ncbi:hypothetical protein Hanom_Chr11g01027861 [Helianthus anomalus]